MDALDRLLHFVGQRLSVDRVTIKVVPQSVSVSLPVTAGLAGSVDRND